MARRFRRFRAKAASATRRSIRYVRSSYSAKRRHTRSGENPLMNVMLPAFAYGSIRQTAKNYAAPLTNMLPLGDNNDEVVFGLGGYLLMKNTNGFMHDFGRAMLTVEAASLGHNIVNPMLQGVTGQASSSNF